MDELIAGSMKGGRVRTAALAIGLFALGSALLCATPLKAQQPVAGAEIRREDLQRIGIRYELDHLNDLDAWHDLSLDYSRLFRGGPAAVRVNLARRFSKSGAQFETEAYPRLSQRTYVYLAAAASADQDVFLPFRAAIEPYLNLPNGMEASLGARFLKTSDHPVVTFTGTVARYSGNYWLSFRPSVSRQNGGTSYAGSATWRKYFTGRYDYLSVVLSGTRGLDPEARDPLRSTRSKTLHSLGARMERRQPLASRNVRATYGFGFEREEIAAERFRRHATLTFGFEWFKP